MRKNILAFFYLLLSFQIFAQTPLLQKADAVLAKAKVYSVMDKVQIPPSGDKHDYMSQGPY
jgi:hypothetical protein